MVKRLAKNAYLARKMLKIRVWIWIFGNHGVWILCYTVTVSYTHLDVYKRQVQNRVDGIQLLFFRHMIKRETAAEIA